MSFWDKVKDFTRPYADEEYDDYEDEMDTFEEEVEEAPRSRRSSPFASVAKEELTSCATLAKGEERRLRGAGSATDSS